jgi:hypothetical protein
VSIKSLIPQSWVQHLGVKVLQRQMSQNQDPIQCVRAQTEVAH